MAAWGIVDSGLGKLAILRASTALAVGDISRVVGFVRSVERVAFPATRAFVEVAREFVAAPNAELPEGVFPIACEAAAVTDFIC